MPSLFENDERVVKIIFILSHYVLSKAKGT